MAFVSAQPEFHAEVVEYLPAEQAITDQDQDAIEVMWMERLARPWHPTPSQPIRPSRCTGVVRSGPREGRRCGRTATLGTTVCESHGAQLPVVKKAAEDYLNRQRLRLIDASGELVDILLDLARTSTSDAVRLKATTEGLDRAGLRGGVEVDVSVGESADPGSILRERLATLKRRTVDGEVVIVNADDGGAREVPQLDAGDTVMETPASEESP